MRWIALPSQQSFPTVLKSKHNTGPRSDDNVFMEEDDHNDPQLSLRRSTPLSIFLKLLGVNYFVIAFNNRMHKYTLQYNIILCYEYSWLGVTMTKLKL